MIQYKKYIVEVKSAGKEDLDHKQDIICYVYIQNFEGIKEREVGSFLIMGYEIADYGSTEKAVTAYMRRRYPDKSVKVMLLYRFLNLLERLLQKQQMSLLVQLLNRHDRRITSFPAPDEYGGYDYPLTMLFYDRHKNLCISVTDVYLDEQGKIRVDGINEQSNYMERGLQAYPEHYSKLLDFILQALGFPCYRKFIK